MKVSEFVSGRLPVTVREEDTLATALQLMVWGGVRHLPVMHEGELVGVLSERDVLKRYGEFGKSAASAHRVGAVMTSPPVAVASDDDVSAAVRMVTEAGVGCLPVLQDRKLIGVVALRDLLRQQIEGDEHTTEQSWADITVDDFMSEAPITAGVDDDLFAAVERMEARGVRHLPVIDAELRVVGMLSDRDVRTAVGNPLRTVDSRQPHVRIRSLRVEDAMSRRPVTLPAGTRLSRAVDLFASHKLGAVPIVDQQKHIVGVLSYMDVLRAAQEPKPGTRRA